jgi:hypothetical protein
MSSMPYWAGSLESFTGEVRDDPATAGMQLQGPACLSCPELENWSRFARP